MKKKSWQVSDLAVIGVFAALIKVSTLVIAFAGGGMNPITLMLKNCVFTTLLVVLLYKVRKFGVLMLFTLVSGLVSLLLMGGGLVLLPGMLVAGLLAESLILACGGYHKNIALLLGVATFDLFSKGLSLGLSWLVMREQPQILIMASVMIAIGYIGSLIGLGSGVTFVRELRHAGIVHN